MSISTPLQPCAWAEAKRSAPMRGLSTLHDPKRITGSMARTGMTNGRTSIKAIKYGGDGLDRPQIAGQLCPRTTGLSGWHGAGHDRARPDAPLYGARSGRLSLRPRRPEIP